jgi:hypothetical protein
MKKYIFIIMLLVFSITSCSKKHIEFEKVKNNPEIISVIVDNNEVKINPTINHENILFNWFTVNDILENVIFSYIDKEKIYSTIPGSWGTIDNGRNLDSIRIRILFRNGYWNDLSIYNDIIEYEILNKAYSTILNLNENKDILKLENMEIISFFPFKIISPKNIKLSKYEIEKLESLVLEEFGIEHIFTIKGKYCEGYIPNKIDLNRFLSFMKMKFGNNIILEM